NLAPLGQPMTLPDYILGLSRFGSHLYAIMPTSIQEVDETGALVGSPATLDCTPIAWNSTDIFCYTLTKFDCTDWGQATPDCGLYLHRIAPNGTRRSASVEVTTGWIDNLHGAGRDDGFLLTTDMGWGS